jgi:four helix bundle protein
MRQDETRVYRSAMELVQLTTRVVDRLPEGFGFLAEQLRRATCSVPLSFTEGSARCRLREQRRYFHRAGASAREVGALLDVAHRFGLVRGVDHDAGKELCDELELLLRAYR